MLTSDTRFIFNLAVNIEHTNWRCLQTSIHTECRPFSHPNSVKVHNRPAVLVDIVTFQGCTRDSVDKCSAEISNVLQSCSEFSTNFASNFCNNRLTVCSMLAFCFSFDPRFSYIQIVYPPVHSSHTNAVFRRFCHFFDNCTK